MKKIELFDTVHIPDINKTGFVIAINKNKLTVQTLYGNVIINKSKVELINDN